MSGTRNLGGRNGFLSHARGSVSIADAATDTLAFFGADGAAQAAALTAEDGSTVDTNYGQEEADVIANLVTRVGELEAALVAYGLLAES